MFSASFSLTILHINGPPEKERKLVMLHLKQEAYTPVPPRPKRKEADPSVDTRWLNKKGEQPT